MSEKENFVLDMYENSSCKSGCSEIGEQERIECWSCREIFNWYNKPIRLRCNHDMCAECLRETYKGGQMRTNVEVLCMRCLNRGQAPIHYFNPYYGCYEKWYIWNFRADYKLLGYIYSSSPELAFHSESIYIYAHSNERPVVREIGIGEVTKRLIRQVEKKGMGTEEDDDLNVSGEEDNGKRDIPLSRNVGPGRYFPSTQHIPQGVVAGEPEHINIKEEGVELVEEDSSLKEGEVNKQNNEINMKGGLRELRENENRVDLHDIYDIPKDQGEAPPPPPPDIYEPPVQEIYPEEKKQPQNIVTPSALSEQTIKFVRGVEHTKCLPLNVQEIALPIGEESISESPFKEMGGGKDIVCSHCSRVFCNRNKPLNLPCNHKICEYCVLKYLRTTTNIQIVCPQCGETQELLMELPLIGNIRTFIRNNCPIDDTLEDYIRDIYKHEAEYAQSEFPPSALSIAPHISCCVCANYFDPFTNLPLVLLCKHNICSACAKKAYSQSSDNAFLTQIQVFCIYHKALISYNMEIITNFATTANTNSQQQFAYMFIQLFPENDQLLRYIRQSYPTPNVQTETIKIKDPNTVTFEEDNMDECPICMEDYTKRKPPHLLPCYKHRICRNCIVGMIKTAKSNIEGEDKYFVLKCPFDNKAVSCPKDKSEKQIVLTYFKSDIKRIRKNKKNDSNKKGKKK